MLAGLMLSLLFQAPLTKLLPLYLSFLICQGRLEIDLQKLKEMEDGN